MTNVNRRLVTDEVRELVVSALLSDPSYVLGRRYAEEAFKQWSDDTLTVDYADGDWNRESYDEGYEDGYNRGFEAGFMDARAGDE